MRHPSVAPDDAYTIATVGSAAVIALAIAWYQATH